MLIKVGAVGKRSTEQEPVGKLQTHAVGKGQGRFVLALKFRSFHWILQELGERQTPHRDSQVACVP